MVLLLHPGGPGPADLDALYAHPAGVRLNMVTSVDGAATLDGRSKGLSGPADRRLFHLLRAHADVVLVGAGTARSERYRPVALPAEVIEQRAERGQDPRLPIAVVSNGAGLPAGHPLLGSPDTLLLTTREGAAASDAPAVAVGEADVDVRRALAALQARGLTRVLCEGGPTLNGALLDADLVDEVCVTTTALAVGGGGPRIVASAGELTRELSLASLVLADGMLFARWIRPPGR